MIAEKGIVKGVFEGCSGCSFFAEIESWALVRSVREAEERRSATADVAVVIGLIADSI